MLGLEPCMSLLRVVRDKPVVGYGSWGRPVVFREGFPLSEPKLVNDVNAAAGFLTPPPDGDFPEAIPLHTSSGVHQLRKVNLSLGGIGGS